MRAKAVVTNPPHSPYSSTLLRYCQVLFRFLRGAVYLKCYWLFESVKHFNVITHSSLSSGLPVSKEGKKKKNIKFFFFQDNSFGCLHFKPYHTLEEVRDIKCPILWSKGITEMRHKFLPLNTLTNDTRVERVGKARLGMAGSVLARS